MVKFPTKAELDAALKSIALVKKIIKHGNQASALLKNLDLSVISDSTNIEPSEPKQPVVNRVRAEAAVAVADSMPQSSSNNNYMMIMHAKNAKIYKEVTLEFFKTYSNWHYELFTNKKGFRIYDPCKLDFAREIITKYNERRSSNKRGTVIPTDLKKFSSWITRFTTVIKYEDDWSWYKFKTNENFTGLSK